MRRLIRRLSLAGAALAALASISSAAINIPSDGSDGVFAPTSPITIDLSQAVTGHWDDNNSANAGKGIYDPEKWAVVFKYASINIPNTASVKFKNHPSGAPVVWLVQGDVTIRGEVNLNGSSTAPNGMAPEAGPGGFRGGASGFKGTLETLYPGFGMGPGGGSKENHGTYATSYGSEQIVPLIGGSGGAGSLGWYPGGAGGGAILIATSGTLNLIGSGRIYSSGGQGVYGGSGGAIRIIADTLTGSGNIYAAGYYPSGRIRIEANDVLTYTGALDGTWTRSKPATPNPLIWPPATAPRVTVLSVGDQFVPTDPHAKLTTGDEDITLPTAPTVKIRIQGTNVPVFWKVVARVVPLHGSAIIVDATLVSGDDSSSVWDAMATLPVDVCSIQARAYRP